VHDASELSLVTLPSVHPAALHLEKKKTGLIAGTKPGIRGFPGTEGLIMVFNLTARVIS
jgi:hypothetical protein